jgi:hypothetical protein
MLGIALAALLGAIILVVALVVTQGGGSNAEAVVISAVNSTMSDKTAQVTMSSHITGSFAGGVVMSGKGGIDFTQNAMSSEMSVSLGGQQLDVQVLYLGGIVYENMPEISQLVPGKSWVSLDLSSVPQSAATGSPYSLGAIGNPAAMLHLLAQHGNIVISLGPSTVDGVGVQGYAVTVNLSEMRSELANQNLPSWLRQISSSVDFRQLSFRLYIDANGLLRREIQSTQVTVSSGSVTADETLDFSEFGSAVNVVAPPSDQVVDFGQFLKSVEQAGSSGQT